MTELDQTAKDAYKIRRTRVTLLEVPLEALRSARRIPRAYAIPTVIHPYRPLSKYPPVVRDIALIVDRTIPVAQITQHIQAFDARIESVDCFDEFVSNRFGEGRKSVAFHIYYADPTQTLTDEAVNALHGSLEETVRRDLGADVR